MLSLPLLVTHDAMNADLILAIRSRVKQNSELRSIAKLKNITIYTIYSSTVPHIIRALRKVLNFSRLSELTFDYLYDNKEM